MNENPTNSDLSGAIQNWVLGLEKFLESFGKFWKI